MRLRCPHKLLLTTLVACCVMMALYLAACLLVPECMLFLTLSRTAAYERVKHEPKWWQRSIVYQIYPPSFQDSNGDGIGDLNGIVQRMSYLQSLGVGALWLNPIYPSPMKDNGYDVSNHSDVNPIFGTLSDFDNLVQAAHKAGLRVIMDFVPNHSSDQHPWFQLSRKRTGPYDSYYIWVDKDPLTGRPPNNWRSSFGGTAWTWDEDRGQYYLHSYLSQQPDLNWRHPPLVQEMHNVLRFWLDRGVDGFRVDAIGHLFESTDFLLNEPESGRTDVTPDAWQGLRHDYTMDLQPELGDAIREWRKILDEYEQKDRISRFMVAETHFNLNVSIRKGYYDYGASMPFNFDFTKLLKRSCGGRCLETIVRRELDGLKPGQWPNFVLGSHDTTRTASKMGSDFVDICNMLLLLLPGTPTTYYGEEIGMHNVEIPYALGRDIKAMGRGEAYYGRFSRDPYRTPMQWDSTVNAGFTSAPSPWLPLSPDARDDSQNVMSQERSARGCQKQLSHLQFYRLLASLRQRPSFRSASLRYAVVNDHIFSFLRYDPQEQSPDYLVAMNFGSASSTDDYSGFMVAGEVVLQTAVVDELGTAEGGGRSCSRGVELTDRWKRLDLASLTLKPGEGVVVKSSRACPALSIC